MKVTQTDESTFLVQHWTSVDFIKGCFPSSTGSAQEIHNEVVCGSLFVPYKYSNISLYAADSFVILILLMKNQKEELNICQRFAPDTFTTLWICDVGKYPRNVFRGNLQRRQDNIWCIGLFHS